MITILASIWYCVGENKDKLWKYTMGCLIGVWFSVVNCSVTPLLAIPTYFLASWAVPYGENSPITKLFGNRLAIAIHGFFLGLASFPIIGWVAFIQGVIGGVSFYVISIYDDKGKITEPIIGILRGVSATILLGV